MNRRARVAPSSAHDITEDWTVNDSLPLRVRRRGDLTIKGPPWSELVGCQVLQEAEFARRLSGEAEQGRCVGLLLCGVGDDVQKELP